MASQLVRARLVVAQDREQSDLRHGQPVPVGRGAQHRLDGEGELDQAVDDPEICAV